MANTRSLKGKKEELCAETYNYDIVCLTEIHIDSNIYNYQISDYNNKSIYRKERTLHSGGVLIAVNENLNSSFLNFDNGDNTELVFVRVKCCIVGCYYCLPTEKDLTTLRLSLHFVAKSIHLKKIILVSDMNMLGINWNQMLPGHYTPDQSLQLDFLDIFAEVNMHQLIAEPTHIHGNTPDLFCTTSPEIISHNVVFPGLTDHAIISVDIF